MTNISVRFLCAIFLSSIFVFVAQAQTQPTKTEKIENDDEVIRVESKLVVVPVSVTDANGEPVLGLTKNDFSLLEENAAQEIAQVSSAENVPLEIALLFDVSSSTGAMFQFEQETAAKFLREVMKPEDRASIFTIGARAILIQPRDTAEKSTFSIKAIRPKNEQTSFYDSVKAAADYLRVYSPKTSRKVVIAISDGEDTNSAGVLKAIFDAERKITDADYDTMKKNGSLRTLRYNARDVARVREQKLVLRSLQNADTVFYAVNPAGASMQFNQISQFGQSNLIKFADETGGTAFLPTVFATNLKDQLQNSSNARKNEENLTRIFRRLANELRAQYLIQYYSDRDFPENKYVKLSVGLKNSSAFKLRARQGYFVK